MASRFEALLSAEAIPLYRFREARSTLASLRHLFHGRTVLDYGASRGLSMAAMVELGAETAVGVEPDSSRVAVGRELLAAAGFQQRVELQHVPNTLALPFRSGAFAFVLANAVFEHIPQPRDEYIAELWRVVAPGGVLCINETPNKYYPRERHTTGLWFNHWLPCKMAYRRAIAAGRFDPSRADWSSSGWRGCGYWELRRSLRGAVDISESRRPRHRIFELLGLPGQLLDPYPTWLFLKSNSVENAEPVTSASSRSGRVSKDN